MVPVLAFVLFLAYSIITEYKPDVVEEGVILNEKPVVPVEMSSFQVTTYNIGYCGLDAAQDFFMDGGTMSRSSSLEQTERNLFGVLKFMTEINSDAYLLQEVDENSSRSFKINQVERIVEEFPSYTSTFAYNFRTGWVPIPLKNPMGKAISGLLTLSKKNPVTSTRYQLPGDEPLPNRYFDLKRAILMNTYPLDNGKTLILMNVHLSAFDEGGLIRAQQVEWLINYIEEIYDPNENYFIIGGDWNHLLSQEFFDRIEGEPESWIAVIPDSIEATGFNLAYDKTVNTVRSLITPYEPGVSFETVIDGFLVSPNVKVVSVMGHDLGFKDSDHQPVTAVFGFEE
ncbi:MAG: endonuclease/exonuclease/phosphatase family protein [Clostridia bacterium]|nr:endonuclease/exonuclease/phosphatase family protein [Clostridia bacterium]